MSEKLILDTKVETLPITSIKPYHRNPRTNDKSVALLVKAISRYGFTQPVTVDKDGVLVTGHSRYFAARELNYTELPVIVLDGLTDKQIAEYRIADNAAADHTKFDEGKLAMKFDTLELDGFFEIKKVDFTTPQLNATPPVQGQSYIVEENAGSQTEQKTVYDMICPHCLHEFEYEK